jgi:hypothetical protein
VSNDGAAEVVAALARALRRQGIDWYLLGAQAVIYWGRPRLSADVDVSVFFPRERAGELMAALAKEGLRPLVDDVDEFVARTRVLPVGHQGTGLPADVIFAGPGLEDEFRERVIRVEIGGETIPIISPEELLVTKILAGRPKDVEDALSLPRTPPPTSRSSRTPGASSRSAARISTSTAFVRSSPCWSRRWAVATYYGSSTVWPVRTSRSASFLVPSSSFLAVHHNAQERLKPI